MTIRPGRVPMKLVFELKEALRHDPKRIELAQALTLDESRPGMGLRGRFGLFASQQWWDHIEQGKMPRRLVSGVISRVYISGQNETVNNTIDLVTPEGVVRGEAIYVNRRADLALFQVGHRADILYALDELKHQPAPDGGVNYSRVALEVAVSLHPA
ncbi:hypothetical protein CR152_05355 [Massilia violaceinigra]|uniref:Uncharacterized protein n=1 Tax=Massilia violaceinigra TaxID=2045208 RepID=A0A2D2DGE7_9BURK|nr:hypothetical protein [Massilia violaceinigra]ATQ74009.1 hypothetical protein CR152_05355 [Massilia violaceinigra]